MERDKLFFDPVWLVTWITHTMVGNLNDNFSYKESRILLSNSKVKQLFLWDHSVNYMFRLGQFTSSVQTWPSARQISLHCSRTGGKVLKEVKIFRNRLMLRAAATWRGSEASCCWKRKNGYDVSYATGVVVFIITYFHKLIQKPFDDKQTFFTWKIII